MADVHSTRTELEKASTEHFKVYNRAPAEPSHQLLLFYAVECGLKARYLARESLLSTSDFTSKLPGKKYGHGHKIMDWIAELSIPASALSQFAVDAAEPILQLHEKLRYGVTLSPHCIQQVAYLYSIAEFMKSNP